MYKNNGKRTSKGWFLKVTPGTKFATLGGCIASDVHGKEHHLEGCFSEILVELKLTIRLLNIDWNRHCLLLL